MNVNDQEELVQALINDINRSSPYKKKPAVKKKWMTVPEMGNLLGLKKTDRYWLLHKDLFLHVLYRVTPVFEGSNLVASGVLMEAESVEDKGEGILCCVYVYNVQLGININYATGDSSASGTNQTAVTEQATQAVTQAASRQTSTESYILNTNTKEFHRSSCSSVKQMKESNKKSSSESRDALIAAGYDPCKKCNP